MKAISIRNPSAYLLAGGVKTVENRTWRTDYRGKVLIHATKIDSAFPDYLYLPESLQDEWMKYGGEELPEDAPQRAKNYVKLQEYSYRFYHREFSITEEMSWLKDAVKKYGFAFPSQAIIGEATLVDIRRDVNDPFAEPNYLHWMFDDAILYEQPIINVLGKLRLWEFRA